MCIPILSLPGGPGAEPLLQRGGITARIQGALATWTPPAAGQGRAECAMLSSVSATLAPRV